MLVAMLDMLVGVLPISCFVTECVLLQAPSAMVWGQLGQLLARRAMPMGCTLTTQIHLLEMHVKGPGAAGTWHETQILISHLRFQADHDCNLGPPNLSVSSIITSLWCFKQASVTGRRRDNDCQKVCCNDVQFMFVMQACPAH